MHVEIRAADFGNGWKFSKRELRQSVDANHKFDNLR